MVEATDAECFQTTLGAGGTHNCPIGQCGLLISTASASVCGLEARIGTGRCEASATVQCGLWLCSGAAVQASLFAPSKEACCLAILGGILTIGSIALGATT